MSTKVKNSFDTNQDLEKIIDTIYEKGRRLQMIANYKDLLSEITSSINEWKNLKKKIQKHHHKKKNSSIKLVSGSTRSGKIFSKRELRSRKTYQNTQ